MLAGALDAGKKIGDALQEAAARMRWSQQKRRPSDWSCTDGARGARGI
jgi:hypothetical protein